MPSVYVVEAFVLGGDNNKKVKQIFPLQNYFIILQHETKQYL